jgi:hypothetical protein
MMANKLLSFLWYLIKDTLGDVGEFFRYVTKKKTWVAIWGLFALTSFAVVVISKVLGSIPDYRVPSFAFMCFFVFYMAYQWQIHSDIYLHEQREKYKKV